MQLLKFLSMKNFNREAAQKYIIFDMKFILLLPLLIVLTSQFLLGYTLFEIIAKKHKSYYP